MSETPTYASRGRCTPYCFCLVWAPNRKHLIVDRWTCVRWRRLSTLSLLYVLASCIIPVFFNQNKCLHWLLVGRLAAVFRSFVFALHSNRWRQIIVSERWASTGLFSLRVTWGCFAKCVHILIFARKYWNRMRDICDYKYTSFEKLLNRLLWCMPSQWKIGIWRKNIFAEISVNLKLHFIIIIFFSPTGVN